MKKDRVVARTFAWGPISETIEEIDYFVIAQDDSIPAKILALLSGQTGEKLSQNIRDLGALLYAPAAAPLLNYLGHSDESIRRVIGTAFATDVLRPTVN